MPQPSEKDSDRVSSARVSSEWAWVEVTRGPIVESRHAVSYCVWHKGEVVRGAGDLDSPVIYRSAAKPLQTIQVVESGAPERFGFTDEELAMVVGSHDGSRLHAARARSMLGKVGVSPDLLRCGGHRALDAFASALLIDMDLVPRAAVGHWYPKAVNSREGDPVGRIEVQW